MSGELKMKKIVLVLLIVILLCNSSWSFANDACEFDNSGTLQVYHIVNGDSSPLNYVVQYGVSNVEDSIDVLINFAVFVNGIQCETFATGTIPICDDLNGRKYLDGPLNGIIKGFENSYNINVGFQKYLDEDALSLTLVVQDSNNMDIVYTGAYGIPVLNTNNIRMKSEYEQQDSSNLLYTNTSNTFVSKGSTTSYHSGSMSGKAQTVRVYYDSTNTRIAVGVNSYSNIVNNYYLNGATSSESVSTGVQNFDVDLVRVTLPSSISGIEENTNYQGDGTVGVIYGEVFSAGLAALNFPSSLLTTFFSGCSTGLTVPNSYSNHYTVRCNAGALSYHLDSSNYCAPVIFQIVGVSSVTNYKATTKLTYKTLYMEASGNLLTYYTSAPNAERSFYIN